jgi:DNA-binding transcriptional LysR family regulator
MFVLSHRRDNLGKSHNDMEVRQIRSFLSVAETLHFGRSARLLHLSQPALSLQIKSLEDELGVELLKRNRQGTVLTEAGRIFRDHAGVALEQLEGAKRKAQWAALGKLGRIRIGFISTAGYEIVPNLMRRFRKLYSEVEFSLRNILTNEQIEMIQNATLDVGFYVCRWGRSRVWTSRLFTLNRL